MKYYQLTYRCYDETARNGGIAGHYIYTRWEVDPIQEIEQDDGDDFQEYDGHREWLEIYETRAEAEEAMQDLADNDNLENIVFLKEEENKTEHAENIKSKMKYRIGDVIKRTGTKAKWCPLRIVSLKIGNCATMNRYRTLKACVGFPVLDGIIDSIPRYANSIGHSAGFLENKFVKVF